MSRRKRTQITDGAPESLDLYRMEDSDVEWFSSGCALLDCVLSGTRHGKNGGGWARRRLLNVVGDESVGKTLLAIEACANYARAFPDDEIHYIEVEKTFDVCYAETLGLPVGRVDFPKEVSSVEDLFEFLETVLERPCLCIVDSLDGISDRAEQARAIDAKTYGATKASMVSQWFRRQNQALSDGNVTLLVISQVREKIGVAFGENRRRSGGKALDFYASQVVWLRRKGLINPQRGGVKRPTGVIIQAKARKNKVARPHRECEFPLMFDYGIEDVHAGLKFLIEVKRTAAVGLTKDEASKLIKKLDLLAPDEYAQTRADVNEAVVEVWDEIERRFTPSRRKYAP